MRAWGLRNLSAMAVVFFYSDAFVSAGLNNFFDKRVLIGKGPRG